MLLFLLLLFSFLPTFFPCNNRVRLVCWYFDYLVACHYYFATATAAAIVVVVVIVVKCFLSRSLLLYNDFPSLYLLMVHRFPYYFTVFFSLSLNLEWASLICPVAYGRNFNNIKIDFHLSLLINKWNEKNETKSIKTNRFLCSLTERKKTFFCYNLIWAPFSKFSTMILFLTRRQHT